jgi:hypothetical protein
MNIFCDHINLHQATMTPTTVMPGVNAAYTVSPWNNTQECGTKQDKKNSSLADGVSCSNYNQYLNTKQHREDKLNLTTLDGSEE